METRRQAFIKAADTVLSAGERAVYRQLASVAACGRFDVGSPHVVPILVGLGFVAVSEPGGFPGDPALTVDGNAVFDRIWEKVEAAAAQPAIVKPQAWDKGPTEDYKAISKKKDIGTWPDRLFDMPDAYHHNLSTILDTPPQTGVSTVSV